MEFVCRCRDEMVLRAPVALEYADAHLTLLPAPAWATECLDDYGPDGWSDWQCPGTGIRWHGDQSGGAVELRRRPVTSSADYLDHHVVAARSEEINTAIAEVRRWFSVDPERHRRATERLWRGLEALYSPEWEQILADLRAGEPSAIEPAVVFRPVVRSAVNDPRRPERERKAWRRLADALKVPASEGSAEDGAAGAARRPGVAPA